MKHGTELSDAELAGAVGGAAAYSGSIRAGDWVAERRALSPRGETEEACLVIALCGPEATIRRYIYRDGAVRLLAEGTVALADYAWCAAPSWAGLVPEL